VPTHSLTPFHPSSDFTSLNLETAELNHNTFWLSVANIASVTLSQVIVIIWSVWNQYLLSIVQLSSETIQTGWFYALYIAIKDIQGFHFSKVKGLNKKQLLGAEIQCTKFKLGWTKLVVSFSWPIAYLSSK
jgi:hypothetical protein